VSVPAEGRLNVLVVYDGKGAPSATQRISFGQPFATDVASSSIRISFEHDHENAPEIAAAFERHRPDLLVLSRYTSARGEEWIQIARGAQIPVLFHLDDDLLAVPRSLGEAKFKAYNDPGRLAALKHNVAASDLIYVSTAGLAERFNGYRFDSPVIAGDLYCSVAPDHIGALVGPATGPVIGYMGTGGHSADLAMILPAVRRVMHDIPALQFELFGTIAIPSEMSCYGSRVRHLPAVGDYADFVTRLRSLGWWIGLAPLEDTPFNRCKADTKWVEYSLAGMAVIASDLPVYDRACAGGSGILASGVDEWSESLLKLLYEPAMRHSMVTKAQQKLRSTYTHERLREQVLSVFKQAAMVRRSDAGVTPPQPASPAFADASHPPER
jgi:hypothetical protein